MTLVAHHFSCTLASNVEVLRLTGKSDIDGAGNSGDNQLHGNGGKNILFGFSGDDVLKGGKGNDILAGGDGEDEFVFERGGGSDFIQDYEHYTDEFHLRALKGATGFADILANHVTEKNGDLWIVYGNDQIVLDGVTIADLHGGDFIFG